MKEVKVFFVGVHNKPGMQPLDSRTRTGKIIDEIINELPYSCAKTNLCDLDHLPVEQKKIWKQNVRWVKANKPYFHNAIIVLLGSWVKNNFHFPIGEVIHIDHPAARRVSANKKEYISVAVNKIKKATTSEYFKLPF